MKACAAFRPERVRFHTCYGINHGPRIHEASLSDVVGHMLKVNALAYSFEAANPRHEHEYHLWESVKLPDGKTVVPGVITHASNIVEHPELIAERLIRYANIVGRENVIAGADCGFSSQAVTGPRCIRPSSGRSSRHCAMARGWRVSDFGSDGRRPFRGADHRRTPTSDSTGSTSKFSPARASDFGIGNWCKTGGLISTKARIDAFAPVLEILDRASTPSCLA